MIGYVQTGGTEAKAECCLTMFNLAAYFTICRELNQIEAEIEEFDLSPAELDSLIVRKLELEQRAEETYSWGMVEVLVALVLGALILSWLL